MYILVLKYILIALCLAYVNHVFSKKREVLLDVKRHVLEKRLKLYASLHKLIHHVSDQFSPSAFFTMDEESSIKASSDFFSSFYFQLHHIR